MSMKWTLGLLLTTVAVGSIACSDADQDPPSTFSNGSALDGLSIPTRSALPSCTESRASALAYISDEKAIVVCKDGAWQEVELKSSPGAKGDQGAKGADGNDGKNGEAGEAGYSSLLSVTDEAAGTNCAAGGKRIDVGLDTNRNNALDSDEITQTAYVCNPSAPPEPPPELPEGRVVFLSSVSYNGNLGGALGADAKCQALADASVLAGKTFKAWVSDATTSPSQRFTKHGKFVRLDGVTIAESWADLTDGKLAAPITVTEKNTVDAEGTVLTGTKADGTYVANPAWDCNGWTHGAFQLGLFGHLGMREWTGASDWSDLEGGNFCDDESPIYCFEQ